MGTGSLPVGLVTLVFTDIEGSTKLLTEIAELDQLQRRLGPDEWDRRRSASAGLSFDDGLTEARALSANGQ